jgi:hypothetical protein
MAFKHNFDDIECLQGKIGRIAGRLFKEKPDFAPLQVSRIFKGTIAEDKTTACYVRNQDVWDVSQVKALKNVGPIELIDPHLLQL